MTPTMISGTAISAPPTQSGANAATTKPTGMTIAARPARVVARAMLQPGRLRSVSYQSSTRMVRATAATDATIQCHPSTIGQG